jgi:hypothetical protein
MPTAGTSAETMIRPDAHKTLPKMIFPLISYPRGENRDLNRFSFSSTGNLAGIQQAAASTWAVGMQQVPVSTFDVGA